MPPSLNSSLASDIFDDFEFDREAPKKKPAPRKRPGINIEFIEDKARRHITFSKRKAGIMKKAYELSGLTGTEVLLLVASETGHVYSFASQKLQPLIQKPEGKNMIEACLMDGYNSMVEGTAGDLPTARPEKQRKVADGSAVPTAVYGKHNAMPQAVPDAALATSAHIISL